MMWRGREEDKCICPIWTIRDLQTKPVKERGIERVSEENMEKLLSGKALGYEAEDRGE
jgi:hypothetical protein